MKKYFIFLASAAMLLVASCAKEEQNNGLVGETELITVQLNPETKTALGEAGATVWSENDAVSVTVGGQNIGTLTLVEGSTFSGEILAGYDGEAVLNYPAGVTAVPAEQTAVAGTFANGAALLEGTTTLAALRAGEGATLSNKTALLKFSVAQAGDVTFEVGTTKYTVTGCETGATYYACVAPVENVSFVARIGGYLSRQAFANVTFAANKIANLEILPAPTKSSWGVIGLNNDWVNDIAMYNDLDGYCVVKGITIQSTDEFKFRFGGDWNKGEVSGGLTAPNTVRKSNTTIKANITVSSAGIYDVYTDGSKYYIMEPGKLPSESTSPTSINITVKSVDTSYKCLHLWVEGGPSFANCQYNKNSVWTVTIPADQLDQKVQAILTKGTSNGNWNSQTGNSDVMCLRNPMPLKVVSNKPVHN